MSLELDFLSQLNTYIKGVSVAGSKPNKPLNSVIGLLQADESLSIMAMPGGAEIEYMDGTKDKDYNVQINVKSKDMQVCMNALNVLAKKLENISDISSKNNSYEFQSIKSTSFPSFLQQDEKGFFIWVYSISAKLTIYKGVVE